VSDAPRANPYAPPVAAVMDMSPPARQRLRWVIVLHGLWCGVMILMYPLLLAAPGIRGPLLMFGWPSFTLLYGVTIYWLWRQRRWAWSACWVPTLGFLLFGLFALLGLALDVGGKMDPAGWVLLALLVGPGLALVPLQWLARHELDPR
jgi:hypothetical protein